MRSALLMIRDANLTGKFCPGKKVSVNKERSTGRGGDIFEGLYCGPYQGLTALSSPSDCVLGTLPIAQSRQSTSSIVPLLVVMRRFPSVFFSTLEI